MNYLVNIAIFSSVLLNFLLTTRKFLYDICIISNNLYSYSYEMYISKEKYKGKGVMLTMFQITWHNQKYFSG